MKIRNVSLSARLLAIVYLLYIAAGIAGLFGGGISLVQIGLIIASAITLMAIATDIGNWARVFGIAYGCILVTFSFVAFFSADWTNLAASEGDAVFVIIGFLILGLGVWTISVLRRKPPPDPEAET